MNIWYFVIIAISIVLLVTLLIVMIRKENFQCNNNHCDIHSNKDSMSIHHVYNPELPLHMF